jgi:Mrp family chromosome partitioning ATPase
VSDAPQYTSLQDYRRVLREQRVLVVLIILVFTGAAIGISLRQTPSYEASAGVLFKDPNADLADVGLAAPSTQTPDQRSAIAAEQVTEPDTVARAAKILKLKSTTGLGASVGAAPEARTNLVAITAQSSNASRAATVANAFARAASDLAVERARNSYTQQADTFKKTLKGIPNKPANAFTRNALFDRISRLRNLAKVAQPAQVVRTASTPGSPISPQPIRNTVLGFLLGLTVALVAAVVRDALDRRFKSSREIRDALHYPLIGHVRDNVLGRSVVSGNGRNPLTAPELDAFRIIRTNVEYLDIDRPIKKLVVTSAMADEGKSTVACALAAAFALSGRRALLVECDLRRPTLAKRFGIGTAPGLTDYLIGRATPQEILQPVKLDARAAAAAAAAEGADDQASTAGTFVCIVAGKSSPQPAELLDSKRFSAFLEQVAGAYDVVVLDSCPLLSVVDTLGLVPSVDGVVLCVRASRTTRDQARAARSALEHVPPRPTGVVITGVRAGDEGDYGYYAYADSGS